MNISAVAREAGISAASIHNTYLDIAKTIRAKSGKDSCSVLDTERLARKRLVGILRLVREQLQAAERDIIRIASENARLVTEIAVLEAKVASRNIVEIATRSRAKVIERMPFDYVAFRGVTVRSCARDQ
jgi:hypothetical protein